MQLRLPEDLALRLRNAATLNRRSMNAEIIFHLERALQGTSSPSTEPET
ncbi:Arc family DNA-binding protein [Cereibacter sphaeroides]|nr:Arc family DNA-binding protein [Cereibacter sphaeroides]